MAIDSRLVQGAKGISKFHIFIFLYSEYLGKVIQYGPQDMILVMNYKGEKKATKAMFGKRKKWKNILTSLSIRKT